MADAKALASGPSGREEARLAFFSVFFLFLLWLFFYLLADVSFTVRWVHERRELVERFVRTAVGWIVTDTTVLEQRTFYAVLAAAAISPTLFQVVGGGVSWISRKKQITIPVIGVVTGIIWLMIVLFGGWDAYTDFVGYREIFGFWTSLFGALIVSVGMEIVGAILFVYLWTHKHVLFASAKELERTEARRQARREQIEEEGRMSLIPTWLLAVGLALVVLGLLLFAGFSTGVIQ